MATLTASDADGDSSMSFEIVQGNVDLDGDGEMMFDLNSTTGDLVVNDMDEFDLLTRESIALSISVSDVDKLFSTSTVWVSFSGKSLLHEESEDIGSGWLNSAWLGSFYGAGSPAWIFHEKLGWLYSGSFHNPDYGWLYSENLGWFWTNRALGGQDGSLYLFSHKRNSWLLLTEWKQVTCLYDYSLGKWLSSSGTETQGR